MKLIQWIALGVAALFLSACSSTPKVDSDMRYSAYAGAGFLEWETSSGSLADTSYSLPVYRGWPNRPYAVIGDVRHKDGRRRWDEDEIKKAVRTAEAQRGEAVIIRLPTSSGPMAKPSRSAHSWPISNAPIVSTNAPTS